MKYTKLPITSSLTIPLLALSLTLSTTAFADDKEDTAGVRYCTWVQPQWQGNTYIPAHKVCNGKQYRQGGMIWSPGHWVYRSRMNDRIWVPGKWTRPD